MTKEELITELNRCNNFDSETGHILADGALLKFINDLEIQRAYNKVTRWYTSKPKTRN